MEQVLTQLLGPIGLTVFLLLVLFGGWKGWWVFGGTHRECIKEKEEWKELALKAAGLAEWAATLKERDVRHKG